MMQKKLLILRQQYFEADSIAGDCREVIIPDPAQNLFSFLNASVKWQWRVLILCAL